MNNISAGPRHQSMTQFTFEYLREQILIGKLALGESLDQGKLAELLHVSQTPIREALRKLEEQGFVTISPYRGVEVTRLDMSQIQELYIIRCQLETLAAREAAKRMDDNTLVALKRTLETAKELLEKEDSQGLLEINKNFHAMGYSVSGYMQLCNLISKLRDQCTMYRVRHTRIIERGKDAYTEHLEIYKSWANKDPEAADFWTRTNLMNTAEALLKLAREEGK